MSNKQQMRNKMYEQQQTGANRGGNSTADQQRVLTPSNSLIDELLALGDKSTRERVAECSRPNVTVLDYRTMPRTLHNKFVLDDLPVQFARVLEGVDGHSGSDVRLSPTSCFSTQTTTTSLVSSNNGFREPTSSVKILDIRRTKTDRKRERANRLASSSSSGPFLATTSESSLVAICNNDDNNESARLDSATPEANGQAPPTLEYVRSAGRTAAVAATNFNHQASTSGQQQQQQRQVDQNQRQQSGETLSSFESDYDLLLYLGETETEDLVETEHSLDYQDQTWRQSICGGASLAPTIDESLSELLSTTGGGESSQQISATPTRATPTRNLPFRTVGASSSSRGCGGGGGGAQEDDNLLLKDSGNTDENQYFNSLWSVQTSPTTNTLRASPSTTTTTNNRTQLEHSLSPRTNNNNFNFNLLHTPVRAGASSSSQVVNKRAIIGNNEQLATNTSYTASLPRVVSQQVCVPINSQSYATTLQPNVEHHHRRATNNNNNNLGDKFVSLFKKSPRESEQHATTSRDTWHQQQQQQQQQVGKKMFASENQRPTTMRAQDTDELDRLLAEMSQSLDLDSLARYDPFRGINNQAKQQQQRVVVVPRQQQSSNVQAGYQQRKMLLEKYENEKKSGGGDPRQQASSESILNEYDGASRILEQMISDQLGGGKTTGMRDKRNEYSLESSNASNNKRHPSCSKELRQKSIESANETRKLSTASSSIATPTLTTTTTTTTEQSVVPNTQLKIIHQPQQVFVSGATNNQLSESAKKQPQDTNSSLTRSIAADKPIKSSNNPIASVRTVDVVKANVSSSSPLNQPKRDQSSNVTIARRDSRSSSSSSSSRLSQPPAPPAKDYNTDDDKQVIHEVQAAALPVPTSDDDDDDDHHNHQKQRPLMSKVKRRTLSSMRNVRNKFNDFMSGDARQQPVAAARSQANAFSHQHQQPQPQPPKRGTSIGSNKSVVSSAPNVVDDDDQEVIAPSTSRQSRQRERKRRDFVDAQPANEQQTSANKSFGQQLRERLSRSKSRFSQMLRSHSRKRAQSTPDEQRLKPAAREERNNELSNDTRHLFEPGDIARNSSPNAQRGDALEALARRERFVAIDRAAKLRPSSHKRQNHDNFDSSLERHLMASLEPRVERAPETEASDHASTMVKQIKLQVKSSSASNTSSGSSVDLSGLESTTTTTTRGRTRRKKKRIKPTSGGGQRQKRPTSLISLKKLIGSATTPTTTAQDNSIACNADDDLDTMKVTTLSSDTQQATQCSTAQQSKWRPARRRNKSTGDNSGNCVNAIGIKRNSPPEQRTLAPKRATTDDYFGLVSPIKDDTEREQELLRKRSQPVSSVVHLRVEMGPRVRPASVVGGGDATDELLASSDVSGAKKVVVRPQRRRAPVRSQSMRSMGARGGGVSSPQERMVTDDGGDTQKCADNCKDDTDVHELKHAKSVSFQNLSADAATNKRRPLSPVSPNTFRPQSALSAEHTAHVSALKSELHVAKTTPAVVNANDDYDEARKRHLSSDLRPVTPVNLSGRTQLDCERPSELRTQLNPEQQVRASSGSSRAPAMMLGNMIRNKCSELFARNQRKPTDLPPARPPRGRKRAHAKESEQASQRRSKSLATRKHTSDDDDDECSGRIIEAHAASPPCVEQQDKQQQRILDDTKSGDRARFLMDKLTSRVSKLASGDFFHNVPSNRNAAQGGKLQSQCTVERRPMFRSVDEPLKQVDLAEWRPIIAPTSNKQHTTHAVRRSSSFRLPKDAALLGSHNKTGSLQQPNQAQEALPSHSFDTDSTWESSDDNDEQIVQTCTMTTSGVRANDSKPCEKSDSFATINSSAHAQANTTTTTTTVVSGGNINAPLQTDLKGATWQASASSSDKDKQQQQEQVVRAADEPTPPIVVANNEKQKQQKRDIKLKLATSEEQAARMKIAQKTTITSQEERAKTTKSDNKARTEKYADENDNKRQFETKTDDKAGKSAQVSECMHEYKAAAATSDNKHELEKITNHEQQLFGSTQFKFNSNLPSPRQTTTKFNDENKLHSNNMRTLEKLLNREEVQSNEKRQCSQDVIKKTIVESGDEQNNDIAQNRLSVYENVVVVGGGGGVHHDKSTAPVTYREESHHHMQTEPKALLVNKQAINHNAQDDVGQAREKEKKTSEILFENNNKDLSEDAEWTAVEPDDKLVSRMISRNSPKQQVADETSCVNKLVKTFNVRGKDGDKVEKVVFSSQQPVATAARRAERRLVSMTSIIHEPEDELMNLEPSTSGRVVVQKNENNQNRRDSTFGSAPGDAESDDASDSSFASAAASRRRLVNKFNIFTAPRPKLQSDDNKEQEYTPAARVVAASTTSRRPPVSGSLVRQLAKNFDQTVQEQPASRRRTQVHLPTTATSTENQVARRVASVDLVDEPKSDSTWYDAKSVELLDETEVADLLREFERDGVDQDQLSPGQFDRNSNDKTTLARKSENNTHNSSVASTATTTDRYVSLAAESTTNVHHNDDELLSNDGSSSTTLSRSRAASSDACRRELDDDDPTLNEDETLNEDDGDAVPSLAMDDEQSSMYASLVTDTALNNGDGENVTNKGNEKGKDKCTGESCCCDSCETIAQVDRSTRLTLSLLSIKTLAPPASNHKHASTAAATTNSVVVSIQSAPAKNSFLTRDDSNVECVTSCCDIEQEKHDDDGANVRESKVLNKSAVVSENESCHQNHALDYLLTTKETKNDNESKATTAMRATTPVVIADDADDHKNSNIKIDQKFKSSLNNIISRAATTTTTTTTQQRDSLNQDLSEDGHSTTVGKQKTMSHDDAQCGVTNNRQHANNYNQPPLEGDVNKDNDDTNLKQLVTKKKNLLTRELAKYYRAIVSAKKRDDKFKRSTRKNKSRNDLVEASKLDVEVDVKPMANVDNQKAIRSSVVSKSSSSQSSNLEEYDNEIDDEDDDDDDDTCDELNAKNLVSAAKKCSQLYEELERLLQLRQKARRHSSVSFEQEEESKSVEEDENDGGEKQDENSNMAPIASSNTDSRSITSRDTSDQISLSSESMSSESMPEMMHRKNLQKLYNIVNEICSSEETFVATLRLLNVDFRQHLLQATSGNTQDECASKLVLSQPPYDCLGMALKHLPQLQALNESLLLELKNARDQWPKTQKISHVLVKIGPFLKHYSSYIRDFQLIQEQLNDNLRKFEQFNEQIRSFESSHACQKLSIQHHLLKPIQRIPQYRLLLQQYLHHLKPDDADYEDTVSALEVVSRVAEHANQSLSEGANFAKLLALQAKIVGKQQRRRDIIQPGRVFVREGELRKVCRKQVQSRWFVLLNDSLLYFKQIQSSDILYLKYELPLEDCQVDTPNVVEENIDDDDNDEHENEFSICTTVRSMSLIAKNKHERDEWVTALRQTIDDYVAKRRSFSTFKFKQLDGDISASTTTTSHDPNNNNNPLDLIGRKAPIWTPDARVSRCESCTSSFSALFRRHHCRACGRVVCSACSANRAPLMYLKCKSARVCDQCFESLKANMHLYYLPSSQIDERELKRLDEHFKTLLKSQFVRHVLGTWSTNSTSTSSSSMASCNKQLAGTSGSELHVESDAKKKKRKKKSKTKEKTNDVGE